MKLIMLAHLAVHCRKVQTILSYCIQATARLFHEDKSCVIHCREMISVPTKTMR